MLTKLIIIAGPQSSGKTTAFNHLKIKFPNFHYQEEINPYLLRGSNHPGGAFTTHDLEMELVNEDIKELNNLNNRESNHHKTIILETGIFHLVYAESFCGKKIADRYFEKYLKIISKFNTQIIYIDTKPEISWRRRYPDYLARTKLNGDVKALEKYQNKLYKLYPIWLKWYDRIPFKKQTIRNSFITKDRFIEKIEENLKNLPRSLLSIQST